MHAVDADEQDMLVPIGSGRSRDRQRGCDRREGQSPEAQLVIHMRRLLPRSGVLLGLQAIAPQRGDCAAIVTIA